MAASTLSRQGRILKSSSTDWNAWRMRLDRRHPCLHECEARIGTQIPICEKFHAAERRGVAGRDACGPVQAGMPVGPVASANLLTYESSNNFSPRDFRHRLYQERTARR